MKKVFDFIEGLKPSFYDVFGFPTIKVYAGLIEVYFNSCNTIKDFTVFDISGPDEFRMFPNDSVITYVFTFYK